MIGKSMSVDLTVQKGLPLWCKMYWKIKGGFVNSPSPKTNCYRNYSRTQLLLRDHLIVWDSIHGQDFQAPPACTNVPLTTAKRSLPNSELGYNDSQKKLGNFSLPFVVRMKPVEIANYYSPPRNRRSKASQDTVAPRADLGLAGGHQGYRDPLENVL